MEEKDMIVYSFYKPKESIIVLNRIIFIDSEENTTLRIIAASLTNKIFYVKKVQAHCINFTDIKKI